MRKLFLTLSVLFMVAMVTVSLCGCPKPVEQATAPAPDAVPPPVPAPEPAPAAGGEFAWSETPAVANVPAGAIKGMVNGKPFEAKTIRIKKTDKSPVLVMSDTAVDSPTGVITGDTGVELTFPLKEGAPGEYVIAMKDEKDFDKEHAYYWYPQGGDKGPMSVNTDWAAALSVSEWTLAKDPSNEDVLGNVKGKVAVTFGDESKSWVAGEFDGVYFE